MAHYTTTTVNQLVPTYQLRSDLIPTNRVHENTNHTTNEWVTLFLLSFETTRR